ncbi:hybrid sensor histidine kinase/response regulator transcription factor [Larkinella rosea]|uniref:histidine kinase n=1 Tax=Larkinella rosea TaxID=2025312 RepID=A0A3P1C032_9BACT|nr:hybrid sensor histidine kinase/response regulator transcription factor [Larkinella rosea]RRB06403.1 hybrid sensor histidine kinase/response regulator [Larkinella rosea]
MRFFYLFFLLPFTLFAQPKGWQEITISDGLSQGMIYDLEQDRKGFIWVATKDGLNRYDGHNFKVFTHDPYNDFSLSNNHCSALLIDSHQRLWVGTLNQGLNLFDDRTQRFYHININDQTTSNARNYEIHTLAEDPDGAIWVGFTNKFFKISLPPSLRTNFPNQADFTGQIQLKSIKANEKKTGASSLYFHSRPEGQGFMDVTSGVFSFNWQYPSQATKLDLNAFDEKARQSFWFATTNDHLKGWYKGISKTITLPSKKHLGLQLYAFDTRTIAVATSDHLWLMSPEQLFQQDSLTARTAFVAFPPNVYRITCILKDKTGTIWFGTSGYGLRKFNPKIKQFHSFLANTSLSNLYIDRQKRTYVRGEFAYAELDRTNDRLVPFLDPNLPEADRRQRFLMQDRAGYYWVSNVHFETHKNYLFKFSPDWQLLKKYPLPENITFGYFGNQTMEDQTGNLWIGATNGKLLRFNPRTEAFQVFSYQFLLPQSGAAVETYALHVDRSGTFWIGTQQGLVKARQPQINPAFSIYKNTKTDRQSLSNDFVSSLIDDPNQPDRYLWVGTKGGGLERLDKQTGLFEHFTEAQGLPNIVVYGILADNSKSLWLSTNRGLSQFNPRTHQFHNYTKADGLQDDEFNTASFFKATSGELLFGGVNGLTAFRPKEVKSTSQYKPLANIIGLKINNETIEVGSPGGILSQAIEHTQTLELAHDQNLVTLEFGVMNYINSAKNRYRYRLEGIDRDWVEAGNNRFANYAQLPDGNYRFAMMGSADGEVWSKPVELQIRVHPPFYHTWWAYFIYLVILAIIGWQFYRFQMQRFVLQQQVVFEQKEASRLAELDALKTQLFTNISHEFRTPLTLILGPLEQVVQEYAQDNRFPLIQRNAKRLLSLINQVLDLNKLEAGQLKPEGQFGDLASFFRTLASSFESLAESQAIQFTFVQNASTLWADFDSDKVEKIVTNLLSNAFKFTPSGQVVRMNVHYPDQPGTGELILTIQDTGIGIAPTNLGRIFERFYQVDGNSNRSYEGSGIGLALVSELIRVLNGTIDATSAEGVGTTFTVTLPLITKNAEVDPIPTRFQASVGQERRNDRSAVSEPSLLIIDDNADIRAYVRSIFETDYKIIEAVDGHEGLEKATTILPDVVICDLMMPRLDGFGFCRTLKTQEATSHIPVVMLTARATVENRIEGFELGADDYLTKPFNQIEIAVRVRNLVQKQTRLQAYFGGMARAILPGDEATKTKEEAFLLKAKAVIEQHLVESGFGVEQLSEELNLSQQQLVRKLKALTGQTAVEFIRNQRLDHAADLLHRGTHTVSEVAYQVGFESLSYFTKVFQNKFGVVPSAYRQT